MYISKKIRRTFAFLLLFCAFAAAVTFGQEDDDTSTDDAIALFNQAQDAHEAGNTIEAIDLYTKAISLVKDFPEAEYQRASAYLQIGKRDEAEQGFRKALETRENWSLALSALGSLLVDKGEFAEAETILNNALKQDENNFPALAAIVSLRLKTDASDETLKNLLAQVKTFTAKANPPVSLWAAQAHLELRLNDPVSAQRSSANVLRSDQNNINALMAYTKSSIKLADTRSAEAAYAKLVKLGADGEQLTLFKIDLLLLKEDYDQALKEIDAIKQPTKEITALRETITLTSSTDVGRLEKYLETDPKNASVYGRLCTLFRRDDPKKALAYCRRANELEPNNISHAIGFAAALVQAKANPEAISLLNRLLEIDPENRVIRTNLATAYFQTAQYAQARTQYIWLTIKEPELAISYYLLGICNDHLQEYVDSQASYKAFLKYSDPKVHALEIEKVNLRLPILEKQAAEQQKKKKKK